MSAALHSLAPAHSAEPVRPAVGVATVDGAGAWDVVAALRRAGLAARLMATPVDALPRALAGEHVDVLVIAGDIERPATSKLLRRLQRHASATRIVLASRDASGNGARRALNLGADGFVGAAELHALAATVEAVHSGQVCVPRAARRTIAKPSFSHREKEILALMTTGSTNQEIAARLYLTESTVKSHLATAFEKLGVRSRKEAASLLLDPDEGLQATALPTEFATPLRMHSGGAT
jgi:DNA-binding NarL/FixJ family response regulator